MSVKMNIKPLPKRKDGNSDGAFDLEQQFILRLPVGPAESLRNDLQSGSMSLKDKLSIELQSDNRLGIVRYGADLFNTKLVDLPCIVETCKTVDRKTFYKTGDICQIMVCPTEEEEKETEEKESPKKKDSKDKKYIWNHGITAPLKNVRKRRFRKTLKKKVNYMEQPDIEKEVRRLFRMDAEAIDVKYEIINEEEKQLNDSTGQGQNMDTSSIAGDEVSMHRIETGNSLDLMDQDMILPELSSSEDEEEKEVNIMDSGEEGMSMMSQDNGEMSRAEYSMSESQDFMLSGDTGTLRARLSELQSQLEELREKRQRQEDQAATTDDPEAMEQFQAAIVSIIEEENEKEKEFNILMSMLGSTG